MILMGDEARRTQGGNNNAYCEDNETSWFDWNLLAKHADVHRFVTLLNARRRLREFISKDQRVSLNQLLRGANSAWHGIKLGQPDWAAASHSIALNAEIRSESMFFHLIFNAYWEALDFELPRSNSAGKIRWRRWIDTALDSPHDIVEWETALSIPGYVYHAEPRSVVMLYTEL
jgi:glycogen operon protein